MPTPYFGATGFMDAKLVSEVNRQIVPAMPDGRHLMVAILVSDKTLQYQLPSPGWEQRYPRTGSANAIWDLAWGGHSKLWKAIHYNGRTPHLARDLGTIIRRIPLTEAVQLNKYRPNPEQIAAFREVHPEIEIILQIGRKVVADFERPADLSRYLTEYAGLVDYALLDPSGGEGQVFDVLAASRLLEAVDWAKLEMLPGVAGGLDPDNLDRLEPLLERWPDLCWDAEGRLMGERGLATEPTLAYLKASCDLIRTSV